MKLESNVFGLKWIPDSILNAACMIVWQLQGYQTMDGLDVKEARGKRIRSMVWELRRKGEYLPYRTLHIEYMGDGWRVWDTDREIFIRRESPPIEIYGD